MTHTDWSRIQQAVIDQYQMPIFGVHGISHWSRVSTLGAMLAPIEKADTTVVRLFAILHDACRLTDGRDPDHGPRAYDFTLKLFSDGLLPISGRQLSVLTEACKIHTTATTCYDRTIQCCIDADRLDLCRLGIKPDPDRLFTKTAKTQTMRNHAEDLFADSLLVRSGG